eukprot:3554872-Lingulodinium_polyedra.AAC.1
MEVIGDAVSELFDEAGLEDSDWDEETILEFWEALEELVTDSAIDLWPDTEAVKALHAPQQL